MTDGTSALYPPGLAPTAWFSTLRTVLERVAAAEYGAAAGDRPPDGLAETLPMDATVVLDDTDGTDAASGTTDPDAGRPGSPGPARTPPPPADHGLGDRMRALALEAADVPPDLLDDLLGRHAATIGSLSRSFGPDRAALLVALGRGLEVGELDPVTRAAVAADVADLRAVVGAGSVAVRRDDRATTLIAAITVGPPVGPVRLTGAHWDRNGLTDVWLCAVPAQPDPLATARGLFERILPQIGVLRAHLRTSTGPGARARRLHIGLQAVVPDADPDLVLGRLEGWRSAVGQLAPGLVDIVWEQA